MSNIKLLPCPFCGSENLSYEFSSSQGYIICNECDTYGPCDDKAGDPRCDVDAAYNAWDKRAASVKPIKLQNKRGGSVLPHGVLYEVSNNKKVDADMSYFDIERVVLALIDLGYCVKESKQ